VAELAEPKVMAPRTAVVASLAPGQVTVSVIIIVPDGGADAVQLTPAVNVTFCPTTTGFGVASSFTTLLTEAAHAGSAVLAK
jgi:hypothetical protein